IRRLGSIASVKPYSSATLSASRNNGSPVATCASISISASRFRLSHGRLLNKLYRRPAPISSNLLCSCFVSTLRRARDVPRRRIIPPPFFPFLGREPPELFPTLWRQTHLSRDPTNPDHPIRCLSSTEESIRMLRFPTRLHRECSDHVERTCLIT